MLDFAQRFFDNMAGLDPIWAAVAFIGFYVVATVFVFPGSLITTSGGFLFGALWGFVYVSIGFVIGSSLAFLLGRYCVRDWLRRKMESRPRWLALDRAIGREGARFVLLLRLCPVIPFSFLNYGLGVTRVEFWKYVVASWLGMIPAIAVYVYVGSLMKEVADFVGAGREKTWLEWLFLGLGLLVTLGVSYYMMRVARRAIRELE